MKPLPHYYSSLSPFRSAFQHGAPILTFHHVGPRPRGARIKGLYVSPKLFARQLGELAAGGFTSAPLGALELAAGNPSSRYFITFDDGFRDVFEHALPVLQHRHARAIVFLVSDLLGKTNEWQQRVGDVTMPLMDEYQVRDWLSAGQEIGSHTQTHPRLTE
ncbi:MAG: polysaccharide deacetylase family protein, partial [Limisphaerales bacterium]